MHDDVAKNASGSNPCLDGGSHQLLRNIKQPQHATLNVQGGGSAMQNGTNYEVNHGGVSAGVRIVVHCFDTC